MTARAYRVELRRESMQIVEFSADDIEDGDPVLTAARELIDPSDWWHEPEEVDSVAVSDDDGKTWASLPLSDVLRMEKEASQ